MKPRFAESCHGGLIPDKRAEQILQDYIDYFGVKLKKQQSYRAYYSPVQDMIVVPEIEQFSEVTEYYSTVFRETVHSTGHPSRPNRITDVAVFGSEPYSKEELVAELGRHIL